MKYSYTGSCLMCGAPIKRPTVICISHPAEEVEKRFQPEKYAERMRKRALSSRVHEKDKAGAVEIPAGTYKPLKMPLPLSNEVVVIHPGTICKNCGYQYSTHVSDNGVYTKSKGCTGFEKFGVKK